MDSQCLKYLSETFQILEKNAKSFVIADMSKVTMISSAALGEFMGGKKRFISDGGDLVFAAMHIDMRSKLNLMGANKIFRFYNDTRSAINDYNWKFGNNPEHVQLSFPPYLIFVPPIRSLVSRIAKQKGNSNRDSFRIETIVDEVCNNAIEHGLKEKNKAIDLKIKIDPKKIEIDVTSISDPAKMSSLKALLQSDDHITDKRTGDKRGRGLSLIKMLSNELTVNFNESGTSVHVKKIREE
jgi:anti-sigma regulatory factor (Ser/Thr protein kinase)/anti-anti-sigma regulatory factor